MNLQDRHFQDFCRRIHHGPFSSCRYKVARMEKFRDTTPPYRIIRKYLVQERPVKNHQQAIDRQRIRPVKPINMLYYSGYTL